MFGSSVSLKQVRGGEKGERGMEEERMGVDERGAGCIRAGNSLIAHSLRPLKSNERL